MASIIDAVVYIRLSKITSQEIMAFTISASNVVLKLVIVVLSIVIGLISDDAGLRLAFDGFILTMYVLGIVVCLALLRTYLRDMGRRDSMVRTRVEVD